MKQNGRTGKEEAMKSDEIRDILLKTTFRYGKASMGVPVGEISRVEFAAMQVIRRFQKEHPDAGGISAAQLAGELYCSPPALSRILRELEEKGLVLRETDPENRRKARIRLTGKGEEARRKGCALAAAYFDGVLARMGEEKMLQFLSLWKELVEIMENNEA